MIRFAFIISCAISLAGLSFFSSAQNFPNKTIKLIVPAGAGGSADILARLVGEKLHEPLGQRVIVENRSGAGQMIGAELVARANGDGYTILMTTATYTTSAAIRTNLPFDPINDLTGITMVGKGPFLLVVHPSLPVKSVKDLIALAKAKPNQLLYASAGTGTISHLASAVFLIGAKIELVHVPYKSLPPAVTDTVGGHTQMLSGSLPPVLPQVTAKRLRALAVTSAERSRLVPEIPTLVESGIQGAEVQQWWGMFAPATTPKNIVARLSGEVQKILANKDMKTRLESEGAEPAPTSPEVFSGIVKNEISKWRKVFQLLKLNPS